MKTKSNTGVVDLKKRVEIEGTGKVEFLSKGSVHKVHPLLADKLVKNGKAVLKKNIEE